MIGAKFARGTLATHMAARRHGRNLALAVAALSLGGCASSGDITSSINSDTPEKMYSDADTAMSKNKYETAASKFEDLDRSHPYSPEARRSIVLAAYAYYKAGKTPEAIASAERYVALHPGTADAPLAHHIIASSYFDAIRGPERDQSSTKKALEQFKILRARYPDSTYAKGAENKIRICEDNLAAAEMQVARYYLKQGNHAGAINRFKTVVSEYQTTAHVEEALARLTESYMTLGIVNEAQTAAAVLGHNFPESKWYKDSYALLASGGLAPREDGDSWISKAWKSVTKFSLGGPKS
jgi:outer membrane protein assembly factor BamD